MPLDNTPQSYGTGHFDAAAHLDPSLVLPIPHGAARPFAPTEHVQHADGSIASEDPITVPHPHHEGKWTNIPTLWLKDGRPYYASDLEARDLAHASGLPWIVHDDIHSADRALEARQAAGANEPLWYRPRAQDGGRLYFADGGADDSEAQPLGDEGLPPLESEGPSQP